MSAAAAPPLALIYDFDGTLIKGNMMDQELLAELGWSDAKAFWQECKALAQKQRGDNICVYMHRLLHDGKRSLDRELLEHCGRRLVLREGLVGENNWFERIGAAGAACGLAVKHYVISAGLAEMVESCPIAGQLEAVFGSRFMYDDDDTAIGVATTVNYTTKTQHLFRINKNVLDIRKDVELNKYMPEKNRPVPFKHMVYIGDGFTDIPCFRLVKAHGGFSIAVLENTGREAAGQAERLMADNRVDLFSLVVDRHFQPDGIIEEKVTEIAMKLAEERCCK